MDEDALRELGRRLLAALISYQAGEASMDETLAKYVPAEPDPAWGEMGFLLLRAVVEGGSGSNVQDAASQFTRRIQ